MPAETFYKGWAVGDALDALHAYDVGATDAGVRDDAMKHALREHLDGLPEPELRLVIGRHLREHYLTGDALAAGSGPADVRDFLEWLDRDLGVPF